jgi:DNA-binding beta-propeller fold protein YncE
MTRIPSIKVDTLHHRIVVGTVGRGRRGSKPGEFHYPSSVAIVNNRAYVADSWNHRVQVFDLPDWKFAFEFGDFFCPKGIEVVNDRLGPLLFVVDTNNARLCFHQLDGRRIGTFKFETRRFPVAAHALNSETIKVVFEDDSFEILDIEFMVRPPWWTTRLDKPISIVSDDRGFVYVSDYSRRTVEKFDADGEFIAEVLGPDVLSLPGPMVMNGNDLLVADRLASAVFIYNTIEQTARRWDYSFDGPGVIGRDGEGAIWVGTHTLQPDSGGTVITVFTADYRFVRTVTFREVHQPTSVAFTSDRILIADRAARNIFSYALDGTFTGPLREQPYDNPVWSVRNDGCGHIYVATGPVGDVLWSAALNRLYYIDTENSAVGYSEEKSDRGKGGQ